jgi:hypothetical protein
MKQQLQTFFIAVALLFSTALTSKAQTVKAGLNFDGVNDIVVIPHHSALDLGTGAFTFEAWIQADPVQAYSPMMMMKKDTNIGATGFNLGITDKGRLLIGIKGAGHNAGGWGSSAVDLTDGNCHHVVYTRDVSGASDTVRAYIDGVLQSKSVKGIPSADISYNTDLYIGWFNGGFGVEDFLYKGMIKEVRIWNVARSESQINASMDKFLKGNESGLAGYWRFNENSGQEVKDYSIHKNHGTIGMSNSAEGGDPQWQDFCDVMNDVLPPVGVEEHDEAALSVYPNPVKNVLYFNLVNSEQLNRLRIVNAVGQVVYDDVNAPKNNQLDVSGLENGMYFYEMTLTSGKRLTDRFIKQ